jgi:GNAT superfamily N-acetyltransferase
MPADVRIEWGEGQPPAQFAGVAVGGGAAAQGVDTPGADAHWGIAWSGDRPVARLATYLRDGLQGAPGISGLVGHYAASDDHAAVALLQDAAERLRARGAQRVLGPMNGSTWARYRFALPAEPEDEQEPPFLGEPVNPPDYPAQFEAAGFTIVERYESRIADDITVGNPRAHAAEEAALERGISIAPLDPARFDAELDALHALSLRAFRDNVYYSPIDAASFAAQYRPMRDMLDPSLVLLARAGDRLVGYVFAYADPLAPREGRPYRLIVKTLASDPEWRSFGLGALLVERLHTTARVKGLTAAVHALMHVANNSVKISAHTARVFRRYALYEHSGG